MPRGWRLILISLALSATTSPVSSQNEKPQTVAARHLVAIDPGHGGSDAGAIGVRSSILEKNLVLDLALQLGKLLQAESDIAVAYTRNSDIDLSLLHRTEIANHSQGTLLISLHAGSSSNPDSHGPRVFYLPAPQPKAGSVTGTAVGDRGMGSKIPATSRPLSLRLIPWERAHEPYDAASAGLARGRACLSQQEGNRFRRAAVSQGGRGPALTAAAATRRSDVLPSSLLRLHPAAAPVA